MPKVIRSRVVAVRLTWGERRSIKQAARRRKMTISAYLRDHGVAGALNDLGVTIQSTETR